MPVLRFVDSKMEKFIHPLFLRSAFAGLLLLPAVGGLAQSVSYPMPMDMQGEVIRLSDADASCEQLYAEATWLEKQVAALPPPPDPMEAARQMQDDMRKAQQKMMGASKAKSLGTSLLSMVPGVGGLAAGALSSTVGRPNTDAMYAAVDKSMRVQQESMAASMRLAKLQGRREHLTTLFLDRECKVSALDREALALATRQVADGNGETADPSQDDSAKDGEGEVSPSN